MTGWTYWGANLTYLPGLLYFAASTALYIFGTATLHLQDNGTYFIIVAMIGLAIAVAMNIVGLEVGKWLATVGAIGTWIPMILLIGMGMRCLGTLRLGDADHRVALAAVDRPARHGVLVHHRLRLHRPRGRLDSWARRSSSRGAAFRAPSGSPVPASPSSTSSARWPSCWRCRQAEITGLAGIMDAITATGKRIGLAGLAPIAAILIVLNTLGGVGVWLAAPARLPFVAGIDNYLPRAFGRLHPKYRHATLALLLQAGVAAFCAVLGQAGETPKQAYEILVSLGVVAFFLPTSRCSPR